MVGKFLLGFWILRWISFHGDPVMALTWPTPLQESFDERNDVEIFRAVVESMREWELHKKNCHRSKRHASRVCYDDIGCFEDAGPFSYLEMLPSAPKDVGTRFLVYGSRKARSIPMEVPAEDINDKAYRAIDPDLPTKVIVHGFGSSCDHIWVYEMRSALMSVQECNIVCVDWGPGSAVPNYVRAAANTRLVGRQLAKLVRSLNVPLEKIHLIGFSLGAHVAGFAGAELGNVSRITGLDPAGPLFESQDPRARLDATDAHFVDVIHSNGEPLILGGLGSWQQMGDVDFYPNGGRMQTGCSNLFLGAVSDIIWSSTVEGRSLCNHRRAYKLFTDSVSPKCRFPAFPCEHGYDGLLKGDCFPCSPNSADRSCGDMGFYSDKSLARGQLYLVTRDEEPFCAHQYQIKVYNSLGERPARSYGKLELTLVGEGSFNETFTMTRKDDEELLVGAILQKIVVPHPAVVNLEGIEIKYTAYSGWISSGLVSWNIDKVTVVDSFGKNLSVCKRGLILESGHPIYLPLYPGECNIPPEPETTLSPMTVSHVEQFAREKQAGIGPFTKDQNFEQEAHSVERTKSQKGLGPFTKDHNVKAYDEDTFESRNVFNNAKVYSTSSSSENDRRPSNSWSIVDLNDGEFSNSLENTESEKGRGFSGSGFRRKMSSGTDHPTTAFDFTTEFSGEIQEPVLKQFKKETGRSLRLPEITEPILRPRTVKQNVKRDSFWQERQPDSAKATSSRAFTIQFLPERLAGILAQAERYARQTLLPLISQYTPSFIGGARHNEPKYFPPLGDIAEENLEADRSREIVNSMKNVDKDTVEEDRNESREDYEDESSWKDRKSKEITNSSKEVESTSMEVTFTTEKIDYPETTDTLSSFETVDNFRTNATTINGQNELASREKKEPQRETYETANVRNNWNDAARSHEGKSLIEKSPAWSPRVEDTSARSDFKADDYWVPIIDRNTNEANQTRKSDDDHPQRTNESSSPMIESTTKTDNVQKIDSEGESKENATLSARRSERKFIPLIDFERPDEFFVSTGTNNLPREDEGTSSTETGPISHIQRIPGPASTNKAENIRKPTTTSPVTTFPYVYESKKDPRTRYIPLIPAEDMGRQNPLMERDR